MNNIYGYIYIRKDTGAEQQKKVMEKLSVADEDIYLDCLECGEGRPKLARMERKLSGGDLVYVKSLSWLGDSYDEILDQWETLTKKKKADVVVLDSPLLDTRRGKDIMDTFLRDIVTEMLTFVAENEHDKNSRRQRDAYLAAKAKGARYGRPAKALPENFNQVCEQWEKGEISGKAAAERCGMALSTFRYQAKQRGA